MNSDLTQYKLKEHLDYDPDTGIFLRRVRRNGSTPENGIAGCVRKKGYRIIEINDVPYTASRLAWLYVYGEWPNGQIDHINHDPDDNRIENLRVVTQSENFRNSPLRSNNTSGHPGVTFRSRDGVWIAQIKVNGQYHHLGSFEKKRDAIKVRKNAEKRYGFHKNHGQPRQPQDGESDE